jgi:uncharacterized repeat protein (TIGR03837 family)
MDIQSIDIFCRCIDNFGDAGVTYRFAREFKIARAACRVRVFMDGMDTLHAIVSGIDAGVSVQEYESITYISTLALNDGLMDALGVADVMVEMFACHIPERLLEAAYSRSSLIINLEYLSAEGWVEGYHLKESLLGRGASIRKFYFMPGLREATGGLIVNSSLERLRSGGGLDRAAVIGAALEGAGIRIGAGDGRLIGTLFTYERGFDALVSGLADFGREALLLVFGEKSQRGMAATLSRLGAGSGHLRKPISYKNVTVICLPFIGQHDYDALLCCADFNIVRGEDSLARAILSGKPFIWNAYIQEERYQIVKVEALLETMRPYYEGLFGGGNHHTPSHGDSAGNSRGSNHPADFNPFPAYRSLMLDFNAAAAESTAQSTGERYEDFFRNLKKHERAASAMYYLMVRNCNLIAKFGDFLDNYRIPLVGNP